MANTRKGNGTIGIRELAKSLDLSIGTISRSLNNRYGVNPETRAKVLEAARRLGYVPNTAARNLKAHPAFQIGVLFNPYYGPHGEVNPYATGLINSLQQQATTRGLGVHVIDYENDEAIAAQFDRQSIDVPVMLGEFPASAYRMICQLDKPCISLGYRSHLPRQVSILPDSRVGAETAVQYLAALGHERIALVNGPGKVLHFEAYRTGYCAAMHEFRLPLHEAWMVEVDRQHANADGACEATAALLQAQPRPTAIVYSSDWLATGGLKAIHAAGLRAGQDVSILGFDNLPEVARLDPPLTTFDLRWPMAVRAIIRLTFDLGAGQPPRDAPDNVIYLHPNLIKRQSCACLRQASSR